MRGLRRCCQGLDEFRCRVIKRTGVLRDACLPSRDEALGTHGIGPGCVSDAGGRLCQPLPERAFLGRAAAPSHLEHLVRVEGQSTLEEVARLGHGVRRRDALALLDTGEAHGVPGKRATKPVAWAFIHGAGRQAT